MILQFNGPEDARWQLLNYKVDDIITDYTGATNGAKIVLQSIVRTMDHLYSWGWKHNPNPDLYHAEDCPIG
jgi:hypothetical protein